MKKVKIHYISLPDDWRKEDKLQWFSENKMENIPFEILKPDKNANWINLAEENDWESLMPICSKEVKGGIGKEAIFKLFSLGVVTARDEWVYDFDKQHLGKKVNFLIEIYNKDMEKHKGKSKEEIRNEIDYSIKWTRAVKNDLEKGKKYEFEENKIIESLYRPFVKQYLYFSKELNEMQYQLNHLFANIPNNIAIAFSGGNSSKPFQVLGQKMVYNHDLLEKTQCLPFYRYDKEGNRTENITDWALQQFQAHYGNLTVAKVCDRSQSEIVPFVAVADPTNGSITKEDIFHYVYAVLHNPKYRQKYELNLKRDFPRIPFYTDFEKWVAWGKTLMDLHINYETVISYQLAVINKPIEEGQKEKPKLKAFKDSGEIQLTDYCSLTGIPAQAYQYKLGNRSAIEWVLDQYKESKPTDPTIRDKFNTYKFTDYKTQVIDLLKRVCTVSMETVKIVEEMAKE